MDSVDYKAVDWLSFFRNYGIVPQKRKKHKQEFVNVYAAFDIETSTIWTSSEHTDAHSFMYSWQFQIEDLYIHGRRWGEFGYMLYKLKKALEAYAEEEEIKLPTLLIWVHNLSFEYSFLSAIYGFHNDDVFFRAERKPIYCRMLECFEFRCSYIQTNLSLKMLCKQAGVKQKLSGEKFDYSKVRYPWTPLTEYEEEYCRTDVESLVSAMRWRVESNGDTLATVPLTSTGYVRRDCKKAIENRHAEIMSMKPGSEKNPDDGIEMYKLLRAAFRGGNTHCSRFRAGRVYTGGKEGIFSYDIASSYPAQQLTKKFPMSRFQWIDNPTVDKVIMYIGLGYAVVGEYGFTDIRLKKESITVPYINLSRTKSLVGFKVDNGRVLEAPYMEIALTEIDLEIVLRQYDYGKIFVHKAMIAKKDFLPLEYRAVIMQYYTNKTKLKGATDQAEKYLYMKDKNKLNSIYGMSATDPVHQEILYNGGDYIKSSYDTMSADEVVMLLKRSAFPYQWGVYRRHNSICASAAAGRN